jgi:hypothetical protein
MTESASSSKSAFAATDRPSVDGAYALRDLSEVVQRFHRSRDASWLSIARSIAAGLGVEAPIAADVRPEATARPFPAATVFLLGATSGGTPGCIGHVSARPATWTVGGAGLGVSDATIAGGSDLAQAVKTAVLESVRPVSPEAVSPDCEIIIPTPGEGDSQALAVAIAAMHALLGCGVPPGLAATGGFDPHHTKFRTVPIATLPAKLAAAGRWGLRTLVVVEGQPLPDDLPDGLRIIEASRDPEALPLLVLQLASDAGWEESAIAAWQRALALYDLRVASRRDEPIDSVVEVIRPFLDPVAGLLDPGAVPIPSAVQAATRTANCDPILVGLAADIRSRVLLHAGRSVESAWWDAMAVGLRGLGDLPDGLLGDHLLLRQPSHRSVLAIDLGDLDDPDPADPNRVSHPHVVLDASIDEWRGRWCTRHQSLLAIFATNTRWRRRLYLARRDLDRSRFDEATRDLFVWRARWEELLEDHAQLALGMADTSLPRQWNYVLEHAVTDASLRDPDGFAPGGGDPAVRRAIAEELAAMPGLCDDLESRRRRIGELRAFDVRGLLHWSWLAVEESISDDLRDRCLELLANEEPADAARVAEWCWRVEGLTESDRSLVLAAIRDSVVAQIESGPEFGSGVVGPHRSGIQRLVALRRAAILDLESVPEAPGKTWVESVTPPSGPDSLQRAFEDLRSRPELLLVRTPY